MSAIEKLLKIAENEVGYLEKKSGSNLYSKISNAGSANYTKYGYEMHKLYPTTMDYPAAWCDCFVDWCFVQAFGFDVAAKLLHRFDDYTVNSAGYYKNNGEWYKSPKVGDQIFFTNSKGGICHTGLVYKVDNSKVYTIEGNTSSASGVVANGGCVAKKSYSLSYSRIAGYGRPNYSIVGNATSTTNKVITATKTGGKTVNITLNQLQKGDKGKQVMTLQRLLQGFGFSVGSAGIDGELGNDTIAGVKAFQKGNGLIADGVVGEKTWTALLK